VVVKDDNAAQWRACSHVGRSRSEPLSHDHYALVAA
jgi:hypothetical protein